MVCQTYTYYTTEAFLWDFVHRHLRTRFSPALLGVWDCFNQQAAISVADDFDETIARLSHVAGSLKLCDDSVLRAKGYRTIRFRKHKYLMVYTVDGDRAYVEGIYHDLQDYEGILQ